MINSTHIIPIEDLQEHSEDMLVFMGIPASKCACSPKIEPVTLDSCLVVHNSFDGREGLEMAKEILGL